MAVPIVRHYNFPKGYRLGGPVGLDRYKPWNGAANPSPARILLGATQTYNIVSVPADLSTLILNAPNGKSYTFQFVYNASAQTTGIKIPLPLSGASTAAQVQTAMAAVLGAAGGNVLGGGFQSFPWLYQTTGAAQFVINYNVAGLGIGAGGTQATINLAAVTVPVFDTAPVVPTKFGRNYGWMYGT